MKKRSVQWPWYPVFRRVLPSILVLLAVFGSTGAALAQGYDPNRKPVFPVDSARWTSNGLQPSEILSDMSYWNIGYTPTAREPFFYDVDVENGWVFAATGRGFAIYDATNPADVSKKGSFYASTSTVPNWNQNDTKFYLYGVDAPAGNDSVAAVASINSNGMLIFDTRAKDSPRLLYQDAGKSGKQVWATTYGNTSYAFMAAGGSKVLVYNLTAALALPTLKCLDNSPVTMPCTNVYVGKVNTGSSVEYVSGAGDYLAASQGFQGIEIWKVSNPSSPQLMMKFAPPGSTVGVALWKEGAKYYLATMELAASSPRNLRIYDVSCIASGGCAQGTLLSSFNMGHAAPSVMYHLSFSRAGQVPYLYAGSDDQFSGNPQREYLLNVSNPSSPVDITPKIHSGGYWGWYYFGNFTGNSQTGGGYNWVMPRHGKFSETPDREGFYYFFRAAYGLFDVHKIPGDVKPTARFRAISPSSDGKFYVGDTITFQDDSLGEPSTYNWSFQPDGTSQEPLSAPGDHHVQFPVPGNKTVSLTVNGNSTYAIPNGDIPTLTVFDPKPVIGGIRVTPAAPRQCQTINFEGLEITGKPPLAYSWEVLDSAGNPLSPAVTGTGTTLNWTTSGATLPVGYQVRLTLSNGTVVSDVETFSVASVGGLPGAGSFEPVASAPAGPVVNFSLPATPAELANASEWSWNFGDGKGWTAWTSHPTNGPKPSYTFGGTGDFLVKVRVRNCNTSAEGIESAAKLVKIEAFLLASFEPFCLGGLCTFSTSEDVPFVDRSTVQRGSDGEPNPAATWHYDWNGDGTFDQTSSSPVASHRFTTVGTYRPKLKVTQGTAESAVVTSPRDIVIKQGGGQGPTPRITVAGPSVADVGQTISLEATATNCTATATGWGWTVDGGTITGSNNSKTISVSWASSGSKTVRATNTGCGTATSDSKVVTVGGGNNGGGGTLKANFTYAPTTVLQNQAISFNGSASTGSPSTYVWNFGDGTPTASGAQVSHTFAQKGTFVVKLTVTKPGSCPPAPFCEDSTQQTIVVGNGAPTLAASFNSEICVSELSFVVCSTESNKEVTFTDASTGNIVSRTWDFGDGETAAGTSVTHTYKRSGTYPLTLTVSDGAETKSFTRNIIVNGGAPAAEAMVLPWIAKTVDGALVQSSDFYLHNPGAEAIDVTLEFRRRGTPEDAPPRATRTIQPNATLFVADVVKSLFAREDVTGFIHVTVDGETQPVVSSFNTTFKDDGSEFGQTVPGYLLSNTGAASSTGNTQVQHLVGLSDNPERFAYFGLSNPGANPVTYRLRFFDEQGNEIGTASAPVTLSRNAAKQYQVKDIRTLFGVSDKDDYRVVVESDKGSSLFPYGANLRLGSNDPSFVSVGTGAERVYLLGALSTPGANNSLWQSDLVIANTGNQVVITEITFTGVGAATNPTDKITETLQPGETRRLADVIGTKWNIRNAVGVLTIDSDAPGGLFPIVQGESYENTNPAKRYGQTLPSLTDKQAAGMTQGQYLVGLRQDTKYRTTFWMFNPGTQLGEYDVVYRALDGRELGRVANVTLGPGKLRQFNAGSHPVGSESSFTVQVIVKKGKVLAAAQVVNNRTNDPAYVQGETR